MGCVAFRCVFVEVDTDACDALRCVTFSAVPSTQSYGADRAQKKLELYFELVDGCSDTVVEYRSRKCNREVRCILCALQLRL